LSSALPLINIYVCTKLNLNPFFSFQDMTRTGIQYEKLLREDNSLNIQGRIIVLVHGTSSHLHLSMNQVSFQSLLYF